MWQILGEIVIRIAFATLRIGIYLKWDNCDFFFWFFMQYLVIGVVKNCFNTNLEPWNEVIKIVRNAKIDYKQKNHISNNRQEEYHVSHLSLLNSCRPFIQSFIYNVFSLNSLHVVSLWERLYLKNLLAQEKSQKFIQRRLKRNLEVTKYYIFDIQLTFQTFHLIFSWIIGRSW